jgi:hypothetical protein
LRAGREVSLLPGIDGCPTGDVNYGATYRSMGSQSGLTRSVVRPRSLQSRESMRRHSQQLEESAHPKRKSCNAPQCPVPGGSTRECWRRLPRLHNPVSANGLLPPAKERSPFCGGSHIVLAEPGCSIRSGPNSRAVPRFVVKQTGLELSKSGKPAVIFQKPYRSDEPQKIVTVRRQRELSFDP